MSAQTGWLAHERRKMELTAHVLRRTVMRMTAASVLLSVSTVLTAQTLPERDAANLRCAHELFRAVGESVWPGWHDAPFSTLLITADHEFAISEQRELAGFKATDEELAPGWYLSHRPRSFPPGLLATFPALSPPEPSIVIGTPSATGKTDAAWIVTVLHEHFHQHQYSQPWYYERANALGLSGGDTTGMWMLNYEFPYADEDVQSTYDRFTTALGKAVDLRGTANFAHALRDVKAHWRELRESLSAEDYRYLQFQLWQEGVARYIELRVAERAESVPCVGSSVSPTIFSDMMQSLRNPALGKQKRIAFYAAGAAIALLLDETSPNWKTDYFTRPFVIETYFAP